MPNNQNGASNDNQNTPPEKPENSSSHTQNTPPEKPENNSSNDNQNNTQNPSESSNTLSLIYYILYIIERLIIATLIMYLILSRFNKKSFKETFQNKDKIIINILSIIILTTAIIYANIKLTQVKENTPKKTTTQVTYTAKEEINTNQNIANKT